MATFDQLVEKYQTPKQIPDDPLYEFLQENRDSLATKISGIGIDALKSPVCQEVRRRCKQDLFWMARYFTWETNPAGAGRPLEDNRIVEDPYRVLCDFFVKKDDSLPIVKQDEIKDRLLLWPRGGMKSTIDVVDTTQWILNFPDIRILYLTGADDLAVGFVAETRGHFVIRQDMKPSLMNIFFPEFCVPEKNKENEFEFTCPVWAAKKLERKETTVSASSVGSTKSGTHFELIKADDPVTDKNAETVEQCIIISRKLSLAKNLLVVGGYYLDYIGTRYHDEDHYGSMLEKNVGEIDTQKGRCWALTVNKTTGLKALIGRAIEIKPDVALKLAIDGRTVSYKEAGADGCNLLIPEMMPYPWLVSQWMENEDVFEGQRNQNPRTNMSTTFDRNDLVAATVPYDQIPMNGIKVQTWDFAYSTKKGRDFSTGVNAVWDDGSAMFVNDLIRDRLRHNDLAQAVVDFAKKHYPNMIGIENSNGAENLESAIIEKARKTGDERVIDVCSRIDWFTPDHQADAKRMRMGTLHPPLMEGRFKIANHLPYLEVLYTEFERCMTSRSSRNDIPDVISQQLRYAPKVAGLIEKYSSSVQGWTPGDALWNMIFEEGDMFGRLGWDRPTPVVDVEPDSDVGTQSPIPGLDPIFGAGFIG